MIADRYTKEEAFTTPLLRSVLIQGYRLVIFQVCAALIPRGKPWMS
jgi:hypothetical protein